MRRNIAIKVSLLLLVLLPNQHLFAQSGADGTMQSSSSSREQSAKAPTDNKITPQQADELFKEVDHILKFASDDTGFPQKHEVKRKLVSRDEVVSYLQKNMDEDKGTQRLERAELVLKKFGLLPRDFDLKTFLITLLREQIAGYYDPKTKSVNLLDWLDVDQQRPVLAHELTHALQDQSFDLDKWMKIGDIDLDEIKDLTADDIEKDEISDARQAVVEGQATAVLIDYTLAPMGQSLVSAPQLVDAMKEGMQVGSAEAPEFQNAPVFIKQSLTFPYTYGLSFTVELLKSGGREKAFAQALTNPPTTTRQIMEPKTYLSGEVILPVPLLNFKNDLKNYDQFDIGAMGEFDVALLVDQYAGTEEAKEIYPAWRGGYYYAAHPKNDAAAPLALVYVSRWASAEKAAKFAAIYTDYFPKRYKRVKPIESDSKSSLRSWLTEEGVVTIFQIDNELLITESLDQSSIDKLDSELSTATASH